jgi:peroxiredoxin
MTLRDGDAAPLFSVRDLNGRRVALGDYYGYPVMVAFYRAAACPLSNLRLWYLLHRHGRFYRHALRLIVLFDSDLPHAHRYLDRFETDVPLIAAREQAVDDRYRQLSSLPKAVTTRVTRRQTYEEARYAGVGARTLLESLRTFDGHRSMLPTELLLMPNLEIARAHYGRDPGDFLPISEIDQFVLQYMRFPTSPSLSL